MPREPRSVSGSHPQGGHGQGATHLVTIEQLSERLGVGRTTLERLIGEGLPAINFAAPSARKRLLRFDSEAVMEWWRAREKGGMP